MEWQPIETFPPDDFPYWESEHDKKQPKTKYYQDALVCGPTWLGRNSPFDEPPHGDWGGEVRIAIASTYSEKGYWTATQSGPYEYAEHIQPTHWMPLPKPPVV